MFLFVFYFCHLSRCYFAFLIIFYSVSPLSLKFILNQYIYHFLDNEKTLEYFNSNYLPPAFCIIVFVILVFSIFSIPENGKFCLSHMFSIIFISYILLPSGIIFLLPEEFFLVIFFNEGLLLLNIFRFFCLKCVYFIFTYEVYTHWIQNSREQLFFSALQRYSSSGFYCFC